jgi:hypothetical protein
MSGIARIQQLRDDFRTGANSTSLPGKEVWLKDGDQAFVSSIATGEEGDAKLDEFYMFTFRDNNRWTNVLKDDAVDCSHVPEDVRPSHKFAFWAYVHEIMHEEKRADSWEAVQGPGGKQLFKEVVDDFRIMTLGFGRSDYVWNQLVEVYEDWGSLDKGVLRIKRTGAGAMDTSYSITATARTLDIPTERGEDVEELPTIHAYFLERYGGAGTAPSTNGTGKREGLGDLF